MQTPAEAHSSLVDCGSFGGDRERAKLGLFLCRAKNIIKNYRGLCFSSALHWRDMCMHALFSVHCPRLVARCWVDSTPSACYFILLAEET